MRNTEHLKISNGIELDSCIREVDFLLDLPYRIWFNSSWPRYGKNGAISYAKDNQSRGQNYRLLHLVYAVVVAQKSPRSIGDVLKL